MSARIALALAALIPAAINASPTEAGRNLLVPVCTGDGQDHQVRIRVDGPQLPGREIPGCCVKGCHANGQRKRAMDRPDEAQ